MRYYTFHNVTVSIRANSGKEAYTQLCNQLAKNGGEWWADTYSTEDDTGRRPIKELFPESADAMNEEPS